MDWVHVSIQNSAANNYCSCVLAALDSHKHAHFVLTMTFDMTATSLFFFF